MNEAYYYFTATLPYLDFDSIPPMSDEAFLDECERLLTEDDFSIMQGFLSIFEYPIMSFKSLIKIFLITYHYRLLNLQVPMKLYKIEYF